MEYTQKMGIRAQGHNEEWLKDLISANPSALGLGDLEVVQVERKQSSGGKIDMLLIDKQDNNAMYELEAMLGDTDASHIIRTIEYWDLEKRRYPQRQHYAVLVAENFERRFFNVIQLLSLNIPLIAIKAELLTIGTSQAVHFVKILDTYDEPAADTASDIVDEAHWQKDAAWVLETAKALQGVLTKLDKTIQVNCQKAYISLYDNRRNLFFLYKRSTPRSVLNFKVTDPDLVEQIRTKLTKTGLASEYKERYKEFNLSVDKKAIESNEQILIEVLQLVKPDVTSTT
jgi:hypothetical protein